MKNSKMAPPKQPVVSVQSSRVAHSPAPVSILTKDAITSADRLKAEEKVVADLRQIFVKRGPEAMRELSQVFDAPLDGLLKALSELPFVSLGSARPKDSIQEGLMAVLKGSGAKNIKGQYAAALKSARGAFFDTVMRDLLRFLPKEEDLRKALWRARLIQDPSLLSKSKGAVEYVVDGMNRLGFDFLINLVEDRRNFSVRRKDKNVSGDKVSDSGKNTSRLNELMWVMAANWTNPDMPLWLMQTPAILNACKLLSPDSPWNIEAVNKTIARGELSRRGRQNPIKEVRSASLGSKRFTLVLKGNEFSHLHGEKVDATFVRPLDHLADSDVVLKAMKFEDRCRELIDIRKRTGKESSEYKDAWSVLDSQFELTQVESFGYRIEVQTK